MWVPDNYEEFAKDVVGRYWEHQYYMRPSDPDPKTHAVLDIPGEGVLLESNRDSLDALLNEYDNWDFGPYDSELTVKVYDENGEITETFIAVHEIWRSLSDYPVLDEMDFSEREYESYLEGWADWGYTDVVRKLDDDDELLVEEYLPHDLLRELYEEYEPNASEVESDGPRFPGLYDFAESDFLNGAIHFLRDKEKDGPYINNADIIRWRSVWLQDKERYTGPIRAAAEKLDDFYCGYSMCRNILKREEDRE